MSAVRPFGTMVCVQVVDLETCRSFIVLVMGRECLAKAKLMWRTLGDKHAMCIWIEGSAYNNSQVWTTHEEVL